MQLALQQQRDSLDKQRQSIHRQLREPLPSARILAADFISPFRAPPQAPCTALDSESVDSIISEAAQRQTLSPQLLRAVMKQESGFKPCAVSSRGAQGLMQLMPSTAQQFHVSDPLDPIQSVQAGAAFLKQLLTRYKGDLTLALAGYNAGPARADERDTRPFPLETQSYLANIFADLGITPAEAATPPFDPKEPLPEKP